MTNILYQNNEAETLIKYYDNAFSSSENGNIYKPFNLWERLSHARKMELLDQLPLPDMVSLVAVDYGVGSWGFGCVFPRLKKCAHAIGIDISKTAIDLSRELSEKDSALSHAKLDFYTSVGYAIPLPDSSVDIFFAGECVEHIEETDTFLVEVHRILKKGGVAIFTTPNRLPFLYRNINLEWCMGYEHVALMSANEFISYLQNYFEVVTCKGFNQSLHPFVDQAVDENAAKNWVAACENDMFNATGMVVAVRKIDQGSRNKAAVYSVEHIEFKLIFGQYRDVQLFDIFNGRLIQSGSRLSVDVPEKSIRCQLILWAHPWSGYANIYLDDVLVKKIDLYAHVGGCRRVTLDLDRTKSIFVDCLGESSSNSQGQEVIVVRAVFAIDSY